MLDLFALLFGFVIFGDPGAPAGGEVGPVTAENDAVCLVSNPGLTGWKDSVVINNCD